MIAGPAINCQVLPDIVTQRTLEAAAGQAAVESATDNQNRAIRIWSGRRAQHQAGAVAAIRGQTMHRKKSYSLGVAIESCLDRSIGRSLREVFIAPETLRAGVGAMDWPLFHICSDKGPDCTCLSNCLRNDIRANLEWHWDPSHGASGCLRSACARAGLACHTYTAYLAYNAPFGEWKDGARIQQVRQSMKDTLENNSFASDAAWQYANAVCPVIGQTSSEHDRYQQLRDTYGIWSQDLRRISMSKYFALRERFVVHEKDHWADRLCGWICAAADLNLLSRIAPASARQAQAAESSTFSAGVKQALRSGKSKKSRVLIALDFYLDLENRNRESLIASLSAPLHRWHGTQQKARTAAAMFQWAREQCDGGFIRHVREGLALVHDPTILFSAGLEELSDRRGRAADDLQCVWQDSIARQIGMFAVGLADSRLSWGADFTHGWPKRSVLLAGGDDLRYSAVEALDEFGRQQAAVAWGAALDRPLHLRAMAANSHLHWAPHVQLQHAIASCGGPGLDLERFCHRRNQAIRMSQLCEDGNKYMLANVRKAPNLRCKDLRTFSALVASPVLHTVHGYERLDTSSAVLPKSAYLAADAFRPDYKQGFDRLRHMVSKDTVAPWYSPGPNAQNATIGDVLYMQYMSSLVEPTPEFILKSVIGSSLFSGSNIVVNNVPGPDDWAFVLGGLSSECHMAWPVGKNTFTNHAQSFFLFNTAEGVTWVPLVFNPNLEWRAYEVDFKSPQWQALSFPDEPLCQGARNVIRMIPTSEESKLLVTLAAERAFWNLSKTWLVSYTRAFDIEVDASGTCWDILHNTIAACLGTEDPDILLPIMYQRTKVVWSEEYKRFEAIRELEQELSKEERTDFQKEMDRVASTRTEMKEYRKLYKEKRRAHTANCVAQFVVEAKAKAKGKAKAKAKRLGRGRGRAEHGAADDYWARRYENIQKFLPDGAALDQTSLKVISPPNGHVWRDWKRAKWHGHYHGNPRFGVHWADGGYEEAGYETVRELWRQHCDFFAIDLHCPVQGLFPDGEAASIGS